MTSPTTVYQFGKMQHAEYEARAVKQAIYAGPLSNQTLGESETIFDKIVTLLQQIREQMGHQAMEAGTQ